MHACIRVVIGKTVGSMCAVCGVLVMALPIPIVVDNFADYYSEQKKLEAREIKKEAQAKEGKHAAVAATLYRKALMNTISAKTKTRAAAEIDKSTLVKEISL